MAIVVTITITIPISPFAVVIPAMVVFDPAARPFPIAVVEESALVTWSDPNGPFVRFTRPVSAVPFVVLAIGIPVAIDPNIARPWRYRPDCDHAWLRWGSDANSNREIRRQKRTCA